MMNHSNHRCMTTLHLSFFLWCEDPMCTSTYPSLQRLWNYEYIYISGPGTYYKKEIRKKILKGEATLTWALRRNYVHEQLTNATEGGKTNTSCMLQLHADELITSKKKRKKVIKSCRKMAGWCSVHAPMQTRQFPVAFRSGIIQL
jgi:hypothetical protein